MAVVFFLKDELKIDPNAKTLRPLNPNVGCMEDPNDNDLPIQMGQAVGLSAGDIAAVNSLYSFSVYGLNPYFCSGNQLCTVGDMNGDGKDDLVDFNRSEPGNTVGSVWVAFSNGNGTTTSGTTLWEPSFCSGKQICTVGDMDGNGKDDMIAFNRSDPGAPVGNVWVYLTNDAGTGVRWGGVWEPSFCFRQANLYSRRYEWRRQG